MFKFTIRELMLLTAVVGLSLGWLFDGGRLRSLLASTENDRRGFEMSYWKLARHLDNDIQQQLSAYGLELVPMPQGGRSVQKKRANLPKE